MPLRNCSLTHSLDYYQTPWGTIPMDKMLVEETPGTVFLEKRRTAKREKAVWQEWKQRASKVHMLWDTDRHTHRQTVCVQPPRYDWSGWASWYDSKQIVPSTDDAASMLLNQLLEWNWHLLLHGTRIVYVTRDVVELWTHTRTHDRFTAVCPGLPGWAGTRRNIHPLTPLLLINHPYHLPPSTTNHSIILAQSTYLAISLHNL